MEPRSQSGRRGLGCAATLIGLLLPLTACGSTPPASPAGTGTGSSQPSSVSTAAAGPSPAPASSPGTDPEVAPSAPTAVTQRKPGWALDRIDQRERPLDQRYTVRSQGKGVRVYVVDGLFDVKNAELGGRATVGLRSGRRCALESGIDHGLFVAGIVGGRKSGVAKQARLVAVGAINGCEGGSGDQTDAQRTARIVRALDWVTTHARRPAVVNLSLNVPRPSPTLAAAVRRVVKAGVAVVASAGNDGKDTCRYPPAGLPSVVTVAAATGRDRDAGLNHGRCVDLFAPGEDVTSVVSPSLDPDRLLASEGAATSWAAPYVSGAAALYLSTHPTASPAQVERWLVRHASRGVLRGDLHGSPNRLLHVGSL